MKKLLTCLAVLLSVCAFDAAAENQKPLFDQDNSFTIAKAVKLGRGKSSAYNMGANLNTGSGTQMDTSKKCDSSCSTCDTTTGKCTGCQTNYIPNGSGCSKCPTGTFASAGDTVCSKCTSPSNGTCNGCYPPGERIDCYDLTCDDGYIQDGDGCMEVTCGDYQRRIGTTCVDNCDGVKCASGYTATPTTGGCCCQIDTTCETGYAYNTTYQGCIKSTYTCNIGCDVFGCGIGSTLKPATGYYIKADGTCPACSTAITGCAECSLSKLGAMPTCTKCNDGYTLSGGRCTMAITTSCDAGYYLKNGTCVACSLGTYSLGGTATSCTTNTTIENCVKYNTTSDTCATCASGYEVLGVGKKCGGSAIYELAKTCPSNTQDCGSTGCCPTTNTCSYYASKTTLEACFLLNTDALLAE